MKTQNRKTFSVWSQLGLMRIAILAGSVLLVASSGLTGPLRAQTTAPPSSTQPRAVKNTKVERHPAIHAAIRNLRLAKTHLEKAAHDFGGHRVKAIQAVDVALKELEAALQTDSK